MSDHKDITEDDAASIKDVIGLLLITATETETQMLHEKMKPLDGELKTLRLRSRHNTFTIGTFGVYGAAHVQCDMGSLGRAGSALTAFTALQLWDPFAVVMPGIAFGRDSKTQKMADVLVSETIFPYGLVKYHDRFKWLPRIFDDFLPPEPLPRGQELIAGMTLVERFKTDGANWNYIDGDFRPKPRPGTLMSGDELVASKRRKKQIFALTSKDPKHVVGGEMEGSGLSAAAHRHNNTEWIVVKGICDWGDKYKNKDHQVIAARAAIDYCHHVFSAKNSFLHLEDDRRHDLSRSSVSPMQRTSTERAKTRAERKLSRRTNFYSLTDSAKKSSVNIVDRRLKKMLSGFAELNAAIQSPEFGFSRMNLLSKVRLQRALAEIIHNAFDHGEATFCKTRASSRKLTIEYDGREFNPFTEFGARIRRKGEARGGGLFSVHRFLSEEDDVLSAEYWRSSDLNRIEVSNIAPEGYSEAETDLPPFHSHRMIERTVDTKTKTVIYRVAQWVGMSPAYEQLKNDLDQVDEVPDAYSVEVRTFDEDIYSYLKEQQESGELASDLKIILG